MKSEWDFYIARVDDAPASITLDLALIGTYAESKASVLHAVQIEMQHAGEHGMGLQEEAEAIGPVEDALVAELIGMGFVHLGRMRNNGLWQITFMAPPGMEERWKPIVTKHLEPLKRELYLVAKPDDDWSYYREFLYPEPERMQWILDRRTVDALAEHGDSLESPRKIDHWMHLPDEASRESVAKQAVDAGFAIEARSKDEEGRLWLRLARVDSAELNAIHEVVMTLHDWVQAAGGTYDGWESPVEK